MKAPLTVSLVSFHVPDSVSAEPFPVPVRPVKPMRADSPTPPSAPAGPGPYFSVPLCELDSNTLDTLCNDFRRSVFELAKKEQPSIESPALPDPKPARKAFDVLKATLCDGGGNVSITGSSQDNELIRRALCTLDGFLNLI